MLQYLVTSKARRRVLTLLWGDEVRGSIGELAKLADVAFASAHAELREMQRLQLARSEHVDGHEVFSANPNHPEARTLRALVAAEVARPVPTTDEDEAVKRALAALGAPLRGVQPLAVEPSRQLSALASGMSLARRDPVVARTIPLCTWHLRDALTARELAALLPGAADRHVAGFFLELTSELGGDRRLLGIAESLRDRRMTALKPFFHVPTTSRRAPRRAFALAQRWGFEMNVDLETFRSLFDKYVTP